MDRTDVAESAAAIAVLLERIDAGEVEATDDERLRLEGALTALAEVVDST